MRALSTLLIAALLTGCLHRDRWTGRNMAAQVALGGLLAVDMVQTMQRGGITDSCDEANPIIGECGERTPVPVYILGVFVLHTVLARSLPKDARLVWQGAGLGIEFNAVWLNNVNGYGPF